MANVYYKRVLANLMDIDNVPSLWKYQVEEMLNKVK